MDADCLIVLDSDGQHDANDIPKCFSQSLMVMQTSSLEADLWMEEVAKNARISPLGNKVITAASNLSSDLGIQDTQSGFRAFSKLAIERLRFDF